MTIVYNILVFLHFIGLASLLGGFLVQMRSADKGVNPAMLHGALTQLVTGLAMVGLAESGAVDEPLDMTKITVKLVIVLVITVLAFIGRRRQPPQVALWGVIGGLTVVNVAVAVFWG
ncbi:MAG: hypothetical protein ACKOW5_11755 [Actinomycetales bacterium]|jgi:hypothetical protein